MVAEEELGFVAVLVWLFQVLMEAELKEELFVVWVPLHPELLFSFVNFLAGKRGKVGKERSERRDGK